jgi:hypothetical protein
MPGYRQPCSPLPYSSWIYFRYFYSLQFPNIVFARFSIVTHSSDRCGYRSFGSTMILSIINSSQRVMVETTDNSSSFNCKALQNPAGSRQKASSYYRIAKPFFTCAPILFVYGPTVQILLSPICGTGEDTILGTSHLSTMRRFSEAWTSYEWYLFLRHILSLTGLKDEGTLLSARPNRMV